MERFNRLVGASVSWLVLLMVLCTFAIVILRYLFDRSWVWMQESVIYMHAFLFLFASAYALSRDAHVRVDILYRPQSNRRKALVNLLGSLLLLLPTSLLLGYEAMPFVLDSWRVLEGSKDPGGIDAVFILKSGLLIFALLLLLQAATVAHASLRTLRK